MHPPSDIDWLFLTRYCAGECTPAEQASLAAWVAGDPSREAWVASVRLVWEEARRLPTATQAQDSLDRAKARLGLATGPLAPTRVPDMSGSVVRPDRRHWTGRPLPGFMYWFGGAVAVAAVCLVLTVHGSRALSPDVFATRRGERVRVQLSDGSRVLLGPASRLTLAVGYGTSSRTVALEGEGFFEVVHNARTPFTIRTAHALIRDVGTTFVTRAYADENTVRVAVAEGEVAVQGTGGASPHVRAGGVATIDIQGDVRVDSDIGIGRDLAWMQGGLVFEDTPFRDVVREIARSFDLDITVADSTLLAQHVTASFGEGPIDRILAAVALPLGAQVERHGRQVIIRRRTVPIGRPPTSAKTDWRTAQLPAVHGSE